MKHFFSAPETKMAGIILAFIAVLAIVGHFDEWMRNGHPTLYKSFNAVGWAMFAMVLIKGAWVDFFAKEGDRTRP